MRTRLDLEPGLALDMGSIGVVTVIRQLGKGSFGAVYEVKNDDGQWAMNIE